MGIKTISVRALPDRISREAPDGPFIPSDRYVNVAHTPYIERLLNVHGDIEQEPAKKAPPAEPKEPAKTSQKEDN